jgi:Lrp/AsnC family leucine-responsive transcriptional regulator
MAAETLILDRTDRRILAELQRDAGLTNQELAERVGLSASPCLRRVKALEEAGVIRRRVALLDPRKLGLALTALIQISMDRHTPERFGKFESTVKQFPEVQSCFLITGQDADYLLMVTVPDMDAYQEFLLNKITRIEGVSGVHSSFIMRRVVDSTALPLDYHPPGTHPPGARR